MIHNIREGRIKFPKLIKKKKILFERKKNRDEDLEESNKPRIIWAGKRGKKKFEKLAEEKIYNSKGGCVCNSNFQSFVNRK